MEVDDEERLTGKKERPRYFEEALSDFTHDVASGGAIRHLVDLGYSTDQIMRRLDFPTPRARVEQTVYRYMTESGLLLEQLPVPEEELETVYLPGKIRTEESRAQVRMSEESRIGAMLRPWLPGKRRPGTARRQKICDFLREAIERDGEENSYMACPFGMWRRDRERRLNEAFACLTGREREYLLGIPWPMGMAYHRLNGRMTEISMQLACESGMQLAFYFLRSGLAVKINFMNNGNGRDDS